MLSLWQEAADSIPATDAMNTANRVGPGLQRSSALVFGFGQSYRVILAALILVLLTRTSLCGQSLKPIPADGLRYVSANGSDSNDGLSWRTARATIAAAYGNLPSCTSGSSTWTHCGTIEVGAGVFKVTSPISISSPFVTIRGRGEAATQLNFAGTSGCAIEWTANPFDGGQGSHYAETISGGLYDLRINGNAASGICGLETYDITGFRMSGVGIDYFTGSRAIGWWMKAVTKFDERYKVQVELENNKTDWSITPQSTALNYPHTTFGYGDFDVSINVSDGQTGISQVAGIMSFSILHIIENMSGTTPAGISLTGGARWDVDLVMVHMEGPGTGVGTTVDTTSTLRVIGPWNELGKMANRWSPNVEIAGWAVGNNLSNGLSVLGGTSGRTVSLFDDGSNGHVTANGGQLVLSGGRTNGVFIAGQAAGTIALSGANGISAGTITMSGGTGLHTFTKAYLTAPVCTATDESMEAAIRATSSRTAVMITGTPGDVVAWICTPAAN